MTSLSHFFPELAVNCGKIALLRPYVIAPRPRVGENDRLFSSHYSFKSQEISDAQPS
ncbi:MAG: hypothetical protein K0S77_268 [Pseudomonas sp.]|jgi:hypothetical protein|nr:hypothetical protein [Pseudomonas sp.]